jgi:hypothetical protein
MPIDELIEKLRQAELPAATVTEYVRRCVSEEAMNKMLACTDLVEDALPDNQELNEAMDYIVDTYGDLIHAFERALADSISEHLMPSFEAHVETMTPDEFLAFAKQVSQVKGIHGHAFSSAASRSPVFLVQMAKLQGPDTTTSSPKALCQRPECDFPADHKGPCSPRLGTR